MPWVPQSEFDFPTLGWLVADQMAEYLGRPDAGDDEQADPFIVTQEQQEYLNELYRLDPRTCRREVHRSVLSRPRGWGKSPFVGGIMIAEAIFDVVPDGWDADGQPVAKPWSSIRTPYVAIAAVTEEQTKNTWEPLLELLRNGSAPDEFDLDPMDSFVALQRGRIQPITASPTSIKGFKAIAASLDQTETWVRSNSGVKLAQTLRNNATKLGGVTIETPNAYTLGERSVAESSFGFWSDITSGKYESLEDVRSIYFDHRPAPASTDIGDHDSLIEGLRVAYGDASKDPRGCVLHDPPCSPGWSDLERIALDFLDTSNDVAVMRADFLNQIDVARDAYVTDPEIRAIVADKTVTKTEPVTLGFDGSEGRKRGIADSTVLVGYSVTQKHLFKIGLWEQPEGPKGEGWRPPKLEVEAAVTQAFKDYNVVGFYADPSAGWAGEVKTWEATHLKRLKVKMTVAEPIRWRQKDVTRTCEAFDQMYSAITAGEITFDGTPDMIRHFLNARRDPRRAGYVLKKPDDDQDFSKIDLTWGSMFAFACGNDALGKGVTKQARRMPRQIA
ncbi:MAG TPA: hypothetical protein VGM94_04920 [Galbitalea sp.]|jgi:hypothetical protein